jgi:hypothetical protein
MSFHIDTYPYRDMTYVKWVNEDLGHHFFERDTMRFFNSKVVSGLYAGRFFITSERAPHANAAKCTIRQAMPSGSIQTVGDFQQYHSIEDAREVARAMAKRVRQTAKRFGLKWKAE